MYETEYFLRGEWNTVHVFWCYLRFKPVVHCNEHRVVRHMGNCMDIKYSFFSSLRTYFGTLLVWIRDVDMVCMAAMNSWWVAILPIAPLFEFLSLYLSTGIFLNHVDDHAWRYFSQVILANKYPLSVYLIWETITQNLNFLRKIYRSQKTTVSLFQGFYTGRGYFKQRQTTFVPSIREPLGLIDCCAGLTQLSSITFPK